MKCNKLLSLALVGVLSVGLAGCGSSSEAKKDTKKKATDSAVTTTEKEEEIMVDKIDYEIDPSKPVIALTFDDGPNTTTTPKVLEVLEKYNVRASFFVIGNNINDESAKVMQTAHAYGHEINNHSQTHSYMNRMTTEEIQAEIKYVDDLVEKYTGEKTKFFRPPYIAVNSTLHDAVDIPFICGMGCNDWDANVSVDERVSKTVEQVEDGVIILLHDADGNYQTVEALERIIPQLLDEGYQFATVSELFDAKGLEVHPLDTRMFSKVELAK